MEFSGLGYYVEQTSKRSDQMVSDFGVTILVPVLFFDHCGVGGKNWSPLVKHDPFLKN